MFFYHFNPQFRSGFAFTGSLYCKSVLYSESEYPAPSIPKHQKQISQSFVMINQDGILLADIKPFNQINICIQCTLVMTTNPLAFPLTLKCRLGMPYHVACVILSHQRQCLLHANLLLVQNTEYGNVDF